MPDAILLDWSMPTMSGVDFLRALRREPSGGKPIVVYCTTEHDVTAFDRETVKATFTDAGLV
jgi:two-component system chemotaxis response regulator CheY